MEFAIKEEHKFKIVNVPRERFSYTHQSLESTYKHTETPFNLTYIDGGFPRRILHYLNVDVPEKNC